MTDIFKDATQSPEARADDLLSRMTLDEKIGQMHAVWLFLNENGEHNVRSDQFTGESDADTLRQMLGRGLGQITPPAWHPQHRPGRRRPGAQRIAKIHARGNPPRHSGDVA